MEQIRLFILKNCDSVVIDTFARGWKDVCLVG